MIYGEMMHRDERGILVPRQQSGSSVGRAIVDNENFFLTALRYRRREHSLHHEGQSKELVIDRSENRNPHAFSSTV